MNQLLKVLIDIRLKGQFSFRGKDVTEDILNVFLLGIAFIYGLLLSSIVLPTGIQYEIYSFSTIIIGVFTIILYFIGTKGILPVHVRFDPLFVKAYPLTEIQRFSYELFVSLISVRSLAITIFLLPLLYHLNTSKALVFLVGLGALLLGNLLNLTLHKYLLNIKIKKKPVTLTTDIQLHTNDYFTIRRLFRDGTLLKLMIIPMLFKLVFIGLEYRRTDRPSYSVENMSSNLIMFATPIFLFIQLFLNLFSHQKDYYSWYRFKDNTFNSMLKSYVVSLSIPLTFDLILAFSLLYFVGLLKMWFIVGNILLTILLVMLGFVTSISRPVDAKKRVMNFRSGADILSTILCFILALLMMLLKYVWVVVVFIICFVLLAWRIYYIKNNLTEYMKYFVNNSES